MMEGAPELTGRNQNLVLGTTVNRLVGSVFLLLVGLNAQPAAQLASPNEAGVAMGHLHYYVRDIAANTRF
jgi:hypothetical protein